MPDTYGNISKQIWRLVSITSSFTYDMRFEISGDIRWKRPFRGSKTQDICSGEPTISMRGMGRPAGVFTAFFAANEQRNDRMAAFYSAAESKAKFTLEQPGGKIRNVRFDPTVELDEFWHASGARIITFGMQEVA